MNKKELKCTQCNENYAILGFKVKDKITGEIKDIRLCPECIVENIKINEVKNED